jgi:hypothetical protein
MKSDIIIDLIDGKFENTPEFRRTVVRLFISSTFTGYF